MKTIVITGASGFLGRALLNAAGNHSNLRIIALTSKPEKLEQYRCEQIQVEGQNYLSELNKSDQEIYCVVNCAYPRDGRDLPGGMDYIESIMNAAASSNVQAFINISSQSVYNPGRLCAADEDADICLDSLYSLGKYMIEKMTNAILRGKPHTSIRLASLIGPGFDQRIVNRFVKDALHNGTIRAEYSGQSFGFFDVKEAAEGIRTLMECPLSRWREVYNLGNGKSYTIAEIVQTIQEVFEELHLPAFDVEVSYADKTGCTGVNADRFLTDTGFMPQITLKETVNRIVTDLMRSCEK